MDDTFEAACHYVRAGLSVIPILPDGSKSPALTTWNPFRQRKPNTDELAVWFRDTGNGIAAVCGRASGNLVVLDFESVALYERWEAEMEAKRPGFLSKLPKARTPRPGVHVYYRSPMTVFGNRKLAMRGADTLIETRGEGGYVLMPGCPPTCHETGRRYEWIQRGWINED